MSPPGKEELLGVGGLLNHRCLRVRTTQGLTTLKLATLKKKKMTEAQTRQGMRRRRIDYLSSL